MTIEDDTQIDGRGLEASTGKMVLAISDHLSRLGWQGLGTGRGIMTGPRAFLLYSADMALIRSLFFAGLWASAMTVAEPIFHFFPTVTLTKLFLLLLWISFLIALAAGILRAAIYAIVLDWNNFGGAVEKLRWSVQLRKVFAEEQVRQNLRNPLALRKRKG